MNLIKQRSYTAGLLADVGPVAAASRWYAVAGVLRRREGRGADVGVRGLASLASRGQT